MLAAQVEPRPKKEAAVRKVLEELYKPKGGAKVRARRPLACVQRRLAVAHFYQNSLVCAYTQGRVAAASPFAGGSRRRRMTKKPGVR